MTENAWQEKCVAPGVAVVWGECGIWAPGGVCSVQGRAAFPLPTVPVNGARMADSAKPTTGKKPVVKVHVLRCRSESCEALLAYEETDAGVLLGKMIDLAERDGEQRYFPCPSCGGRNLVEEAEVNGRMRSRVFGFQPAC